MGSGGKATRFCILKYFSHTKHRAEVVILPDIGLAKGDRAADRGCWPWSVRSLRAVGESLAKPQCALRPIRGTDPRLAPPMQASKMKKLFTFKAPDQSCEPPFWLQRLLAAFNAAARARPPFKPPLRANSVAGVARNNPQHNTGQDGNSFLTKWVPILVIGLRSHP
jgi:hypothetical protein